MKRLLALLLSAALGLSFGLSGFSEDRSCYFNDEENHVYASGPAESRKIALTFDDGPHPCYTDEILDILKEYKVKATFFVIGQNAEYYPEPFQRTVAEGHSVGSHTFSHRHLKNLNEEQLRKEFAQNRQTLEKFGVCPVLFRPPEGVCDRKVLKVAHENGCDIILWSVDTGDWRCPALESILSNVRRNVKGGEIILMHDYVSGNSQTPAALRILLPELLKKGYVFVTVEELIGRK